MASRSVLGTSIFFSVRVFLICAMIPRSMSAFQNTIGFFSVAEASATLGVCVSTQRVSLSKTRRASGSRSTAIYSPARVSNDSAYAMRQCGMVPVLRIESIDRLMDSTRSCISACFQV